MSQVNQAPSRKIRLTPVALALLAFSASVSAQTADADPAATLPQVTVRSKYERNGGETDLAAGRLVDLGHDKRKNE